MLLLRRRRTFVFVLGPDLTATRFKDADLPYQRGILLLALLVVVVRKLSEWLSTDALKFEFLLVQEGESKPLAQEGHLLEMLFREQIENGTVEVKNFVGDPGPYADQRGQRSLCHVLALSVAGTEVRSDVAVATAFAVKGPRPTVRVGYVPAAEAYRPLSRSWCWWC